MFFAGQLGAVNYSNLMKYYANQLKDITDEMNEQISIFKSGYADYQNIIKGMSGGSKGGSLTVSSYQTGTPYVPKTGLALIHQGEEINPPGQRSYDQRKNYSTSINIEAGAIVIQTPKFNEQDGEKIFDMIERKAKQRGLAFARG